VKPSDKILTYEQARELKWFCKNVAGTRSEYYEALDVVNKFRDKIDRLYEASLTIKTYFAERGISFEDPPENEPEAMDPPEKD
jgi:hypothetical protein